MMQVIHSFKDSRFGKVMPGDCIERKACRTPIQNDQIQIEVRG